MSWDRIRAIAARDLTAIRRNRALMGPMLVVPVVFLTFFPLMLAGLVRTDDADVPTFPIDDLLPAELAAQLPAEAGPRLAFALALYLFPTVLVLIPLIVVSAIATDAVAGERERNTLEGLLLTPATDTEILLGKLLAAVVPAVVVHAAASTAYAVGVNLALSGVTEGRVLPDGPWLWVVLWFGPAFTAALLAFAIVVSARARSVQGASQMTSVAVLPHLMAIVSQASGSARMSGPAMAVIGLVLWALAAGLVVVGSRTLQRGRLTLGLE